VHFSVYCKHYTYVCDLNNFNVNVYSYYVDCVLYQLMTEIGNENANAFWEWQLSTGEKMLPKAIELASFFVFQTYLSASLFPLIYPCVGTGVILCYQDLQESSPMVRPTCRKRRLSGHRLHLAGSLFAVSCDP